MSTPADESIRNSTPAPVVRPAHGPSRWRLTPAVSIQDFAFGSIRIDDKTYEHDVVIDRGTVCKRHKTPSKALRDTTGHTPLSASENIPWRCRRLVVGTGAFGRLPILPDVRREAKRRRVELVELPTAEAVELLRNDPPDTNAILHVTC